ncbi:sensor histidine kinase [Streptomyces sp. NRRL S-87]|uniref:sensor histidine kinase n=1 Tax=Streptomyces sp. NRRL S-87 TaxID=1463920 RepID=UPI0004C0ED59|nr:histidine kinase [Streptomyces sp. NRRL S-87]
MTGLLVVALVLACVAAGAFGTALVRARRLYRVAVEERGWRLERERESAAAAAVDAERARIAAELHDIVSHNVSLMVVQAGAAREVLTTLPDQAAAAMLAVETAGRSAMTELRHLLGLLAPAQDGTDGVVEGGRDLVAEPQPSLARLSRLVDRFAFAGLPVEVRMSGEPRPLPEGIDATAYRIVQEALTNALKHGDGVKAEVTVRYAERWLRVEVLNTGPSVLTEPVAGPSVVAAVAGTAGARSAAGAGAAAVAGSVPAAAPVPGTSSGVRPGDRDGTGACPTGTGRGLLGLRERVAVYGGELDARRRLGGGFRVRARIPLDGP